MVPASFSALPLAAALPGPAEKPCLLLCSFSERATGFGRVVAGLARTLAPITRLHVLGLDAAQAGEAWTGHTHLRFDLTRTLALSQLASRLRPALVVLTGPAQVVARQATRLRQQQFTGVVVGYLPVEGLLRNAEPLRGLLHCTAVVAYTAAGASLLAEALRQLSPTGPLPQLAAIAHASDSPVAPVAAGESRPVRRAALLPGWAHRAEGTWLLNGNTLDNRKRPLLTLRGFAAVADRYPDLTLVMHGRVGGKCELRRERNHLGLQHRVILTRDLQAAPWSIEQLSELYACCELGVNTSVAEGWGLVAFEHARHGAAQLLPAHPNLLEIWGTAPYFLPVGKRVFVDTAFDGQELDPADLATALDELLAAPDRLRALAAACASHANRPELGWAAVGQAWRKLLAHLLDDQRLVPGAHDKYLYHPDL